MKTYAGALQKKWATVAIFAEFKLDAPHGWLIKTLVIGSAHLRNEESNKSQKTHEQVQNLLDVADDLNCDILGCDPNKGADMLNHDRNPNQEIISETKRVSLEGPSSTQYVVRNIPCALRSFPLLARVWSFLQSPDLSNTGLHNSSSEDMCVACF